jgi:hypothetical protein
MVWSVADWGWLAVQTTSDKLRVAGLAVAILVPLVRLAFVKRPKMLITVHEESTLLIGDLSSAIPRFEASFDNAPIKDLRVSQFFVWNSGTESIKRDQVAPKEPVRVILPAGIRILDCSLLKTTNPAVNFQAELRARNSILISFDFLNRKDGATFQVLYTGTSEEETEIEGQLIGPRADIEFTGDDRFMIHGLNGRELTVFGRGVKVFSGFLNIVMGFLLFAEFWFEWHWTSIGIGLFLVVTGSYTLIPSRSPIPKALREDHPAAHQPHSSQS